MKYPLCKYAIDRSNSIRVNVKCGADGKMCGLVRWCPHQKTVKMADSYKNHGCKVELAKDKEDNND